MVQLRVAAGQAGGRAWALGGARIIRSLGEGFCRRPESAFAEILQDNQRGTYDRNDRHRSSRGVETVLSQTRCRCTKRLASCLTRFVFLSL